MSVVLEVVAVRWERIQLVVELAVDEVAGALPSPSGLALIRTGGGSADTAPATSEHRTGTSHVVRFDVFRGPRQRPLGPGTWALSVDGHTAAAPVSLRVRDEVTPPPDRSFRLIHCRYDVAVAVHPETATLVLTITIDPYGGRIPPRWPRWRMGRRTVRAAEHATRIASRRLFANAARHTVHRNGRRIVFATAARSGLSGNLRVVHDRMVERGLGTDHQLITLHRPASAGSLRRLLHRWQSARTLLAADAILTAGSLQRAVFGLPYDPDVRFVQLWHASGAFKTVGFSRAGQADCPDPFGPVHRTYSAAIVSSALDVPFYAEAFGLPEDRVIPTGIPRMDRFFDEAARAAGREKALASFPAIRDRVVWLFAPTYRGEARAATYDYGRIDFARLHALATERDAVVILKMHPFVIEPVPIPEVLTDRLIDGTRTAVDVNDLLFVVDLLITDYSSIVFEFSVLRRPMLFFAYDLDEYIATRDFYIPFETFVPGRIVRTFDELLDAIRRDDYEVEKVDAFVRAHFAHLDAGATDRVIDELVLAR